MEFGRCLAVMVKCTSTMDSTGFAERITQYEEACERWAQLIILMAEELYARTYVSLARYALPFLMRYVSAPVFV